MQKTKAILGHKVDLGSIHLDDEDGVLGTPHAKKSTGDCQVEKERYLLGQSDTFRNLEELVIALSALERWQGEIKKKPGSVSRQMTFPVATKQSSRDSEPGSASWKKWRGLVKDACLQIEAKIQPILHEWLQSSQDGT